MSRRWIRILWGRPSTPKRYALVGALAGLVLGLLEALVTSVGASDFWQQVRLHFSQFGGACPFLGALIGYVIATRAERHRIPPGHCRKCGYNLTGNVSGRCPECGATI